MENRQKEGSFEACDWPRAMRESPSEATDGRNDALSNLLLLTSASRQSLREARRAFGPPESIDSSYELLVFFCFVFLSIP